MTELEKLEAGLEYCYDDPEVEARKERAILWCKEYNAIDDTDMRRRMHVWPRTSVTKAIRSGLPRLSTATTARISLSATTSPGTTI